MTKSTPPDGTSSDTNPPQALKRDSFPSTLLFPKNLVKDATSNLQLEDTWKERLLRISKGIFAPRTAVVGFIGLAAIYSFGIGRSRYTSVAEFVIYIKHPDKVEKATVVKTLTISGGLGKKVSTSQPRIKQERKPFIFKKKPQGSLSKRTNTSFSKPFDKPNRKNFSRKFN